MRAIDDREIKRLEERVTQAERESEVLALSDNRHAMIERLHLSPGRADTIPAATLGVWKVEKSSVGVQAAMLDSLRSLLSSSARGRWVPVGDYTRLLRRGAAVMSDTPDELLDLAPFANEIRFLPARRILIHGLGLGCAVRIALSFGWVEHVDVVEIDPDVIALVGPYLTDTRVSIIEGDAYTYRFPPGTKWDVAWHDVWDNISADNDFATLHRRYGGRVRWQGSWCREEALEHARREARERWW